MKLVSGIKEVFSEFTDDNVMQLAAALSFYTLLSLAPLLLVSLALAGLFWDDQSVQDALLKEVRSLVGESGAEVVSTIMQEASTSNAGVLGMVVGIGTLLVGATTVFVQLQASMNQIWDVEKRSDSNAIWSFIRTRLLSIAMVASFGFLLLVSLVLSAVLSSGAQWLGDYLPLSVPWNVINFIVSLVVIMLLLAAIFKVLPDVKIEWKQVWLGAFITALLFSVGKYLIGLYLGHASVGSSYGAAGSVVVLMVWIYYSSVIIFLGAEMTQVIARRSGHRIEPSEHAQRMDEPDPADATSERAKDHAETDRPTATA